MKKFHKYLVWVPFIGFLTYPNPIIVRLIPNERVRQVYGIYQMIATAGIYCLVCLSHA